MADHLLMSQRERGQAEREAQLLLQVSSVIQDAQSAESRVRVLPIPNTIELLLRPPQERSQTRVARRVPKTRDPIEKLTHLVVGIRIGTKPRTVQPLIVETRGTVQMTITSAGEEAAA
jgi:hypothetical protein